MPLFFRFLNDLRSIFRLETPIRVGMKKAVWIPICFLFLVGCGTGDNSPGQTTISFSLPHSMQSSELRSAVTGSQLAFYAVQTSGSADRKIIWHKCETHCESAPPTISLDQVPLEHPNRDHRRYSVRDQIALLHPPFWISLCLTVVK